MIDMMLKGYGNQITKFITTAKHNNKKSVNFKHKSLRTFTVNSLATKNIIIQFEHLTKACINSLPPASGAIR